MKDKFKDFLEGFQRLNEAMADEFRSFSQSKMAVPLLFILLIISVGFTYFYKTKSEKPSIIYVQKDTLEKYTTKDGDTIIGKNTYIQSLNELKKTNEELYEQVKSLSNIKFQPIVVTRIETDMKIDTIYAEKDKDSAIVHKTTEKILNWKSPQNPYYSFNGRTVVKSDFSDFSTSISNFSVKSDLSVSLVEKDKQLKVVASSTNPYVDVSNINSVVIDPKKSKVIKSCFPTKRWHVGPYVGVGFDKNLKLTPSMGISLGYGLLNF